jgi:hypothetical protein
MQVHNKAKGWNTGKSMTNENQMWEAKDKRISFQSLFSSLCELYKGTTPDESLVGDLEKMAYQLNTNLHKKYTYAETSMKPSYKASAYNSKPTNEGETCACGKPREYREGIKNGRKWRAMMCKDKKCTPIWLPNQKDIARANHEDAILEEAQQQFDEYGNPV